MRKGDVPVKGFVTVAWKRLVLIYLVSTGFSFSLGWTVLVTHLLTPDRLFQISTARLSYAAGLIVFGTQKGVDAGLLIFFWNVLGALVTVSFLLLAPLFDPNRREESPRWLRNVLCGRNRMKLLCYLPGCRRFEEESLRRLYVWLMIPLLGMILLGLESGLLMATATVGSGSFLRSILNFLPHGVVEIPAFCLAGALAYSAHLVMKCYGAEADRGKIFSHVRLHISQIPILSVSLLVVFLLFLAAMIEGHLTAEIVNMLLGPVL